MNRMYVLLILQLVYVLSFVDRQIISILAQSIKEDLALSDTELGLLTGFAFALFYAVLGIPVARLAEKFNRVPIISCCVFIWSAMTAAGAAAGSFVQLALTRAGVGVGEAGSVAPAHSMISDMYPPEKRSLAMAIFQLGAPLGILMGFLIGGVMAASIGWRQTLLYVGLSGIVIAVLVQLTLKDPRNALKIEPPFTLQAKKSNFWADLNCLFAMSSFRNLCFGCMLAAAANYAVISFLPAYILRNFDVELSTVGVYLSLIIGIGGGAGLWFGGWMGDRLATGGSHRSLWMAVISMALFAPLMAAGILLGTGETIFLYLIVPFMVSQVWLGPAFAQVQTVAPMGMRATASALVLLFNNLLGLGVGPLLIGLISDSLNASGVENPLGVALMVAPLMAILSCLFYWRAMSALRQDRAAGRQQEACAC